MLQNSDLRTSTALSHPTPLLGQGSRPPSPPPHILGQIVEMGFSVSQAKKALAATENGQDVQAALESLLSGGGNGGSNINGQSPTSIPQTRATPPLPHSHPSNVRGPPKGQKERERERKERELQRARREDATSTRTGPTNAADIQDQADKLLSQASEIGLSVLSRASAFWKEGKEKVVKVMEERSSGVGTSSGVGIEESGRWKNVDGKSRVMDGRPKWMEEVVDHEDEDDGFKEEGFKDSAFVARTYVAHQDSEPTVDLFSSDPIPTLPVSQQRPPLSQRPSQLRTHSRPQRTLPTTSSSTLSLASSHKNTGTSQFKLGQYGPASESYTSAITVLPPRHLLLIPLYTNRSLARLRCGDYVGAGEDAGEALKIICVVDSNMDPNSNQSSNGNAAIWNPDTELPELIQGGRDKLNQGGWLDVRGVGVDLKIGRAHV